MQKIRNSSTVKLTIGIIAIATTSLTTLAAWNQITLPSLSGDYFTAAFGNLPDGRLVFGEHGNIYLQDSWNSSSFASFSNVPSFVDPSFVSVYDANTAAIGHGGWGASDISTFNPETSASVFTGLGVSVQNYDGVFNSDGSGLYIAGTDTGSTGDRHGVRYLASDGSVNKVIINDVSQYSCGIALDVSGNLFVGDNDDGRIYKFTKSLLDAAVVGASLSIDDGDFICDFGEGGDISSLAVDSNGVIWGAGWNHNGLKSYDANSGSWGSFVPGLNNTNYKVGTFSHNGSEYVAYINSDQTGAGTWGNYPQTGDTLLYGYQDINAVPEPGTALLACFGLAMMLLRRIKAGR